MSNYTKATLKAPTKAAIIADIQSLSWNGEQVYPDFPEDYERSFNAFERFVVMPPRQIVISPATYNEAGEEITPATMGDWACELVLPKNYNTSHLTTVV